MTYMVVYYKYLCHKIFKNEKKWNICYYIELSRMCTMEHNPAFVRDIYFIRNPLEVK